MTERVADDLSITEGIVLCDCTLAVIAVEFVDLIYITIRIAWLCTGL